MGLKKNRLSHNGRAGKGERREEMRKYLYYCTRRATSENKKKKYHFHVVPMRYCAKHSFIDPEQHPGKYNNLYRQDCSPPSPPNKKLPKTSNYKKDLFFKLLSPITL
ncbi:hypothetical protein [Desulfolithobacter sp.]